MRVEDAVVPDFCMSSHDRVRMQDRARADSRPNADDGKRSDGRVWRDERPFLDAREGMHARRRTPSVAEERDGLREREIRMPRPQHRARSRVRLFADDHGRGTRRSELFGVFRIREKREIARTRVFDSRDAEDLDPSVAFEVALETRRNIL